MDKMKTDAGSLFTSRWFSSWAYSATAGHEHEAQRNANVALRVARRDEADESKTWRYI